MLLSPVCERAVHILLLNHDSGAVTAHPHSGPQPNVPVQRHIHATDGVSDEQDGGDVTLS